MEWLLKLSAWLLTLFVVTVAVFDIRWRRIPNFLVFPALLTGLAINSVLHGSTGAVFSLKGIGLAFLMLLIPYLVKGMKAGDVKFLMAIGAFIGPMDVFRAMLGTVLCYPLMAAFAVIRERKAGLTWLRFRRVWWNFLSFFIPSLKLYAIKLESRDDPGIESVKTPFGVAIAAGALIAVFTDFLS